MSETDLTSDEAALEPDDEQRAIDVVELPEVGATAEPELDELVGAEDTPLAPTFAADGDTLRPVLEVPVELVVELGRTTMTIGDTLKIGKGSIVVLDKEAGSPSDLKVNGRLIARGEVVAIDEEFGLRVTEVVSLERLFDTGAE